MSAVTGTHLLREALRIRNRQYLARLARDLGVGLAALEEFAHGRGQLDPKVLDVLARGLFNAEFDAGHDLLKPLPRPEPRSLGVAPAPVDPKTAPFYQPPGRPGPPPPSPGLVAKPTPRPPRPGWVKE